MDISSNGRYIVTIGADSVAKLWDLIERNEIRKFIGHSDVISSVKFNQNGKCILTGSKDQTAKLWNVSTGKELRTFIGHEGEILDVYFHPNGNYIITAGADLTAKLWDARSGQLVRTYSGHRTGIKKSSYLDSYKIMDVPEHDYYIDLFSYDTQLENILNSIDQERSFENRWGSHTAYNIENFATCLSPDGKFLITGGGDGYTKIWDIFSGDEIASLISVGEKNWLIMTPDNYYTCSPDIIKIVAFKIDKKVYPFEQFDLQFNRPDIIIKRLGQAP